MEKKTFYSNGFAIATNDDYEEVVILFNLATPQFSEKGTVAGVSVEQVTDVRLTRSVARNLCAALTQELARNAGATEG